MSHIEGLILLRFYKSTYKINKYAQKNNVFSKLIITL
jgi:hypothetical protein